MPRSLTANRPADTDLNGAEAQAPGTENSHESALHGGHLRLQ